VAFLLYVECFAEFNNCFTRLSPREPSLEGRWTGQPFGLLRVQPTYLNVSRPSEVYDLKLFVANVGESEVLLRRNQSSVYAGRLRDVASVRRPTTQQNVCRNNEPIAE